MRQRGKPSVDKQKRQAIDAVVPVQQRRERTLLQLHPTFKQYIVHYIRVTHTRPFVDKWPTVRVSVRPFMSMLTTVWHFSYLSQMT